MVINRKSYESYYGLDRTVLEERKNLEEEKPGPSLGSDSRGGQNWGTLYSTKPVVQEE